MTRNARRPTRRPSRDADPRPRRRDGDDDPAAPADGGRFPRRAVQGPPARSARQQRPAGADAARRHRRHPSRIPRRRQRHHRDQHVQQHGDRAGRLRARAAGLRAEPRGREAGAGGVRRVHGEGSVAAALRRRRDGADQPHPVDLARRQQPGVPRDDVRRAARGVQGTGARPDRRRLRSAAARDDRRHAEREGRDRRDRGALRRTPNPERRTAAADDFRDDHRSQRPDAVGADDRRVLGVDRARQALQRRHQLRARRARHAAVPRGPGAHRRLLRELLSERRPAECVRRLRRTGRGDRRLPAGVRHQRFRQHRRRLLRHHAGSHQGHRRRRRRLASAHLAPRTPHLAPQSVLGSGDADHPSRVELPDDRRADQRHRLAEVRAADQGGRLRHRDRSGARAGARRRQPHRRQHGRRHARLRAGDDALPELHRHRAGHRARAVHDRQLEVVGDPGGPEVRAGQGRRQLDQPERRRGRLPGEGGDRQALRRRRRLHGVRRAGAGRYDRAEGVDLPARLRAPHRTRGLRSVGHHLRSQHSRDRDRARGAQRLRDQFHRGDADHQGDLPRGEDQRRRQQPVLLLPRQRRRPRGDPLGLPVSRDQGRHGHGHRQRRPARRLRGHSRRICSSTSRTSSSTAGRTRPSGWSSSRRR